MPSGPTATVVVPFRDAMAFLPVTVPTILAAARRAGDVECIYVDNGSTDGSTAFLSSLNAPEITILSAAEGTISYLRNLGASQGRGEILCFLDADCSIGETYFRDAIAALEESGAAATGCEVEIPGDPHWIEAVWNGLHYQGRDRDTHYINSANFVVRRDAFERIGGFDVALRTGEDAEIGQRLTDHGYRIHESTRVRAVHHGNPRSLRAFRRRALWHALGMFGTTTLRRIDKVTGMMVLHLVSTVVGIWVLLFAPIGLPGRILTFACLQIIVPAVTVAFRWMQTRRVTPLLASVGLYWIYYLSRLHALALILTGRHARVAK